MYSKKVGISVERAPSEPLKVTEFDSCADGSDVVIIGIKDKIFDE
jgi:hypothetical protein